MMRSLLAVMVLLGVGMSAQAGDDAKGGSTLPDIQAALVIAQTEVPDGLLMRGRTENKPSGTVFGFYFWRKGRIVEIEINKIGKVVKKKDAQDPEDVKDINPDVAELIGKSLKSKLPEGRLLEIAAENLKDSPVGEVKYEKDGDTLILNVGGVRINATTGAVIK